ncbi:RHS repeat domain-containing protein [Haloferula chungangensis]|uniref:RHS repeat domain-containing protein n=1 Tax=Haloferula chungangensis TaxID=1048331 RepID=A0ABW2LEH8_9BACT
MNRLSQIGGAGRTMVEGELDEPGTNTFTFRREIAVQEGANSFAIAATDASGNRTTQSYSVQVGGTQTSYGYDLNGNLLWEKDPGGTVLRSFEWDAADRLKAVNWGAQRVEWSYDAMGRKVSESVNGTLSRRFLWDGIELLFQRSAAGVIQKKFYGEGEIRIGGTDSGSYFYTRDHLGSVREVLRLDGVLQARYDYDAYGKRMTITQSAGYLGGCDFGYTGHFTRTALAAGKTELVLAHYRAYDPGLGRWLSEDPLGIEGGVNLYGYVGADPVGRWDPLGLEFWSWTGTAGDWAENVAQFSMGMADNLSFGLNGAARRAIYGDDYSDPCLTAYKSGEWAVEAVGLLAGGAGVGRMGLAKATKRGSALAKARSAAARSVYDDRTFNAVSKQVRSSMGYRGNDGVQIHHMIFRNSNSAIARGLRNSGLNLVPISTRLNQFFNSEKLGVRALEKAFAAAFVTAEASVLNMPGASGGCD